MCECNIIGELIIYYLLQLVIFNISIPILFKIILKSLYLIL